MNQITHALNTVKKESPFLYGTVILSFAMALVCIVGMLIDSRTILGVSVWLKPLKFAISGGVFTLTVGYLNLFYPYSNLKKSIINNTIAFTMVVDLGIVLLQGARGVQSHFNQSTLFDAILYMTMGVFITINVLIMAIFIIDTIRLKLKTSKSMQWAILLGWLIIFFGSWVGGQMVSQLSHTVGAVDGGAGLPLMNWSTIAGDLRIAHFFGLHGLQILPFFALILAKRWKLTIWKQTLVISFFGFLYAAWIGFTFYQAKQGIALLAI